jgi:hypothetical protein
MPRPSSIPLLLLACVLAVPVTAQAWSARVQFVAGDAFISARSKAPRAARKGDELDTGDVITTGSRATVQLVMADGSYVSLRPDTRMAIERYDTQSGGSGERILGLLRGGLRAITGHLQGMKGDGYTVRTPTAIIGVRGTDHEVFHVPPVRAGEKPVADPGTYDRVFEGGTFLRTQAGSLDINQRQVGYARDAMAAPALLDSVPVFMTHRPATLAPRLGLRNNAQGAGQPGTPAPGTTTTQATGPAPDAPPPDQNKIALPPPPPNSTLGTAPPPVTFQPYTSQTLGIPIDGSGAVYAAPPGAAGVGGDIFFDKLSGSYTSGSGGILSAPEKGNKILLDGNNNLYAIADATGFRYSSFGATLLDKGSANAGGVTVNWGVYAGGLKFDNFSGETIPLHFHFAYAPITTPPSVMQSIGGTIVFSTIAGFSKPASEQGLGGSVNSFSASIDFTNVSLNAYSIGVTDAVGRTWSGTGTYTGAPVPLNAGAFSAPLTSVSCSPCTGGSSGNSTTIVIGPSGGGVISSYDMRMGTAAVTGNVTAK